MERRPEAEALGPKMLYSSHTWATAGPKRAAEICQQLAEEEAWGKGPRCTLGSWKQEVCCYSRVQHGAQSEPQQWQSPHSYTES